MLGLWHGLHLPGHFTVVHRPGLHRAQLGAKGLGHMRRMCFEESVVPCGSTGVWDAFVPPQHLPPDVWNTHPAHDPTALGGPSAALLPGWFSGHRHLWFIFLLFSWTSFSVFFKHSFCSFLLVLF